MFFLKKCASRLLHSLRLAALRAVCITDQSLLDITLTFAHDDIRSLVTCLRFVDIRHLLFHCHLIFFFKLIVFLTFVGL